MDYVLIFIGRTRPFTFEGIRDVLIFLSVSLDLFLGLKILWACVDLDHLHLRLDS